MTARAAGESSISEKLELTADNVEKVLDEVRPYLIADGDDVELVEIDGLVVKLKLNMLRIRYITEAFIGSRRGYQQGRPAFIYGRTQQGI